MGGSTQERVDPEGEDSTEESGRHIAFYKGTKPSLKHASTSTPEQPHGAVERVFLRGVRNSVSLNFSGLSWVRNANDNALLRMVARVAADCAVRDGAVVYDLSVYPETTEDGQEHLFARHTDDECLMYRMVISLSSNVAVSSTTLKTIESCAPAQIPSVSVFTFIPPGYRQPTGCAEEDDEYKLYVSRGTQYKGGLLGGHVSTNITIYVASENYKQFQQVQSETSDTAFKPRILTSKPTDKRPRST